MNYHHKPNIITIFAIAFHPTMAGMHIEMCGATGWKHYILEGVTDALFLDPSELPQSICRTKTNAGVTPRGVIYTLRSVLRGLTMSSQAHFTGYYILQRGCFLCLFFLQGCGRPRWVEQADASTHVFFL
jgi:hypothetical protein